MVISCGFCGIDAEVESAAAAVAGGWFTHTIESNAITLGQVTTQAIAAGFVCADCGAALRDWDLSRWLDG